MSVASFRLDEIKEYDRDVQCISKLVSLVKNKQLDSNIVYEICYYHEKFKKWLSYGIMDTVVRLEIEGILNSLEELMKSFDEKELERVYANHEYVKPLYEYDKIKYKDTERPLKTTYIRDFYTIECRDMTEELYSNLVTSLLYIPLYYSFGLILLILFCLIVFKDNFLLTWVWSGAFALCELRLIISIIYMLYHILILRYDSNVSWYTGNYRIQSCWSYHYTLRDKDNENKEGQYIYDKVGEMLKYFSVKGYNSRVLWEEIYKVDTALDKFKVLAGVEVDAYYAAMDDIQVYADNMSGLVLNTTLFGAEW